jgi:hypothetical protein
MRLAHTTTLFSVLTAYVTLVLSTAGTSNDGAPTISTRDDEPISAALDPEIARLVESMNRPEPWDHL